MSIKDQIMALGHQHGVSVTPTSLDKLAQSITRLAGDEVHLDDIEMTIVRLGQKGVFSSKEVVAWGFAWTNEKRKEK